MTSVKRDKDVDKLWLSERALNACLDAVAIADLQGRLILTNPAFLRMWGFENSAEVEGLHVTEMWQSPAAAEDALAKLRKNGSWGGEMVGRRKDGSSFYALFYASFIRDNSGKPTQMAACIHDQSHKKKLRQEHEETNQRLRNALAELQSMRQQVIDQERQHAFLQMASGIAHDFNNSLSSILGYSDLLVHDPDLIKDPDVVERFIQAIHGAAGHASNTVRRMRKFYRPRDEEERQQVFDLSAICAEAVDITQPLWDDHASARGLNITVETNLAQNLAVCGNASELHEAITNLVINAADAMDQSGQIFISTKQESTTIILEVSDTGCGMSEETRRRCQEPFFTTKGEEGSGLGLSIVQGVIRRHGGSLEIESELRRGTTFKIKLPAAPVESAASPTPEGDAAAKTGDQPRKILIIEDDRSLHEFLRRTCQKCGHTVDIAPDPGNGLRKFYAGWYDMVITSRSMPDMSGDKLAAIIKATSTDKPIIMLTGYADMMAAVGEKPDAVDAIVAKPLNAKELLSAIEATVAAYQPDTTAPLFA